MNYEESINYIHSIPKFVRPLGNANLGELLSALGNPHIGGKYIHIAGTNGKGSVAAMLSEILTSAGYKTGLFTSPFIEKFNERIQINRQCIPDSELARIATLTRSAMEKNGLAVSEFAFITAMAFVYFKEQNCGFTVLETGLGGRLDATNIIAEPILSVITAIGYDHMQYLGNTLEEIAYEKCGIIKKGCPVVSQGNPPVRGLIAREAQKNGSAVVFSGTPQKTEHGFIYKNREYVLGLRGDYQLVNAAEAIDAAGILKNGGAEISDSDIYNGLKNAEWPVRFEYVRRNVIIDGGHNIDGVKALVKSLKALKKPYIIVAAMMRDKALNECINTLADGAERILVTQIPMPRCASCSELAVLCSTAKEFPSFTDAIDAALSLADDTMTVCICGSLYFAAEAKKYIRGISADSGK